MVNVNAHGHTFIYMENGCCKVSSTISNGKATSQQQRRPRSLTSCFFTLFQGSSLHPVIRPCRHPHLLPLPPPPQKKNPASDFTPLPR